jgi:hypothetical protein
MLQLVTCADELKEPRYDFFLMEANIAVALW